MNKQSETHMRLNIPDGDFEYDDVKEGPAIKILNIQEDKNEVNEQMLASLEGFAEDYFSEEYWEGRRG